MNVFLLLFSRLLGLFLLSPCFSGKGIPKSVRFGAALVCSLLLAPPLSNKELFTITDPFLLLIYILKEAAIGYIVGFLLSLLFEAAAFAGQVIGTLMGFSATELLDPLSSSQYPLLARFFSLLVCALFFILDLHHLVLRTLYSNFREIPISTSPFTYQTILGLIESVSLFFQHALEFAIFPLLLLLSLICVLAFLSRFFSIFWVSFPLQLIVGLIALILSISFFTPIVESSFFQVWTIIKKWVVNF